MSNLNNVSNFSKQVRTLLKAKNKELQLGIPDAHLDNLHFTYQEVDGALRYYWDAQLQENFPKEVHDEIERIWNSL